MGDEEPEFISQTGEPMSDEDRQAWFRARTEEARANGAVLGRYSIHQEIPNLCLFEAWKVNPSDQGEPRWQLTSIPPTP